MSNTTERITKLDAARRQVRTAITLFFAEEDPVSVHTLASAAQELLRGLVKQHPARSFFKDSPGSLFKDNPFIIPERRKEFLAIANQPQNFFKHADRDVNAVLDFNPESTAFCLFDCVQMYNNLTGRVLRAGYVFLLWFYLNYPNSLEPGPHADLLQQFRSALGGSIRDKSCYLPFLKTANAPNVED